MLGQEFWLEVFKLRGSATPLILGRLIGFGLFAGLVTALMTYFDMTHLLANSHYEYIGAVLALLLVLRTNAGYDRWYEARKIWGGIVNQSRNLAQIGAMYGPEDRQWRDSYVRWVAAFSAVCRHSLRNERTLEEVEDLQNLVGRVETERLTQSQHMPLYVIRRISELLRTAVDSGEMDRFYFLKAEEERVRLIDHIGGCERILRTPLAIAFSIKIRRFLFLYLLFLPIALVDMVGMFTPLLTLLVAYPLLALDQIGVELQNPFCHRRLNHLPLGEISATIRNNVLALLDDLPELVPFDERDARAGIERRHAASGLRSFAVSPNVHS
ncbi:MAG: bestrophin family protein [Blastopirellula sp. JB062]